MIKDSAAFRKELEKVNEFWSFGEISALKGKTIIERRVFKELFEELTAKRILTITGPRRVGKTILMKRLIQELLKTVPKQNILYYSMDDPSVFAFSDNPMKDIIDYFLEEVAANDRKYIFLDEIHMYKDWYKWVKAYYDRGTNIKFIISGSASFALQREANKYLRGRTLEFEIMPLTFREFLERKECRIALNLSLGQMSTLESLDASILNKTYSEIKEFFNEYLSVGGFPEWFETNNKEKWFKELLTDIPKKAIYEDLANLFKVKSPYLLEAILAFIVANQSKILSYEKINEIASLDRETLNNYIEYLKSTYLITAIFKYGKTVKEQLKSMKKYCCIDQGLRNAITKEFELNENNIGFVVENVVGIHLHSNAKQYNKKLFYVKNGGEIDFLLKNKEVLPIEVKYKENIKENEITTLLKFVETNNCKWGIVVTKNLYKKSGKILFVPAWLFLLG